MKEVKYKKNGGTQLQVFYIQDGIKVFGFIDSNYANSNLYDFSFGNENSDMLQPDGKLMITIGQIYPRIWRNGINQEDMMLIVDNYYQIFRNSMASAEILIKEIKKIFKTIQPHPENMNSYGLTIRNLLLLSCMEVETSFIGILKANEYQKDRYNTKDYVKLLPILKLNEYSVEWLEYPDIEIQKPFENWNVDNPTTSLDWYDNYNATKHNREENLKKASLKTLIKSISAMIIMLNVQFGINAKIDGITVKKTTPEFYIRDIVKLNPNEKNHSQGKGFIKSNLAL